METRSAREGEGPPVSPKRGPQNPKKGRLGTLWGEGRIGRHQPALGELSVAILGSGTVLGCPPRKLLGGWGGGGPP